MSDERTQRRADAEALVPFSRHLAASEAFKAMFREGMALVEETATYLDGDGRRDSQRLARATSLAYGTESMRLTTRLMQLASWLLLQRAVNEGDLTSDQARHERAKVKLGGMSSATEGATWNELPARLRALIERSMRLQDRVIRLDEALREPLVEAPPANMVQHQLGQLAAAFGAVR
jgi:regulator of CtrA degradation